MHTAGNYGNKRSAKPLSKDEARGIVVNILKLPELLRGPGWLHEIKHDGMRLMARRDKAGVRLITRRGNDFTDRFPVSAIRDMAVPRCSAPLI